MNRKDLLAASVGALVAGRAKAGVAQTAARPNPLDRDTVSLVLPRGYDPAAALR